MLTVGLPARPKSPSDSKKEVDGSALYTCMPSGDTSEHGMLGNRSQVSLFVCIDIDVHTLSVSLNLGDGKKIWPHVTYRTLCVCVCE